jgi:diguanylate cyclase (GGDEF)-like protein
VVWLLTFRDKPWMRAVWLLVCIHTAFALLLRRSYFLTTFGDLTQCALLLSILLSCVGNTTVGDRRFRRFWLLMALGCGLWFSAQVLWTGFEVFLRREVPNPFSGDVGFFLHLVPMMGALALLPHVKRADHISRPRAVDFVLLLVWWLYLYLFIVIPWQYVWPDEATYGRSFDAAYLLEHLVFIVCACLVWTSSRGAWRTVYGYLAGASLLYALSSIAASVAIDFGRYYTGGLFDIPLVISMGWFTTIGLKAHRLALQREFAGDVECGRGVWVSGFATAAAFSLPVLAAWSIYGGHAPSPVRSFRLVLTLGAIVVIGGLRSFKQYQLDKELTRTTQELRDASLTDVLTGAKNRRYLKTAIESDVQQVIRSYSLNAVPVSQQHRDLVFYFIDVDRFKEINDRFGHDQGDLLLAQIAQRISSAIRHSDVLIRWGGEEFLVISRYTNRREATTLATRVLTAVGCEPFRLDSGRYVTRTCSIGWAPFPWFRSDAETVPYEKVLWLADSGLYRAKGAGRNQAIGFLPKSDHPVLRIPPSDWTFNEKTDAEIVTTCGPAISDEIRAAAEVDCSNLQTSAADT